MSRHHLIYTLGLLIFITFSCKDEPKESTPTPATIAKPLVIPEFSRDSAYTFIAQQVAFGSRVPGTKTHVQTKDWLVSKLKEYGGQVTVQEFEVDFLTVKKAKAFNIIATYNPKAKKRISLSAHWDSRMIAEKDANEGMKNKPIDGADDGGSGVGVLIEISRLLQKNPPSIGIDIILFDAEDQGFESSSKWCLGSIYWSKNPHVPNYKALYGIHLDMVGAKNAVFGYEGYSKANANIPMEKVWNLAATMGYGNYFQKLNKAPIEDDHFHMMANRSYPVFDIINLSGDSEKIFGAHHHTHGDNMDIIDKQTLHAVGKVVTAAIYKEDHGSFNN